MPAPSVLLRPMASARPDWAHAVWVGAIESSELLAIREQRLPLAEPEGHATARLLVRDEGRVLGFVEGPVVDGAVAVGPLLEQLRSLPAAAPTGPRPSDDLLPSCTVVLCTRDRPDQLVAALESILRLDHPRFDVVVVDNASATDDTRRVVAERFAGRVRLVDEPRPGLARARNTGLLAASGDVVAFTDDDVLVDPFWLRGLAEGFASARDVVCVAGLVPSGELRTAAQAYFDDRVSWSRNVERREYRTSDPPADLPLFPFSVGEFGTGANFAVRRAEVLAMGGFDTAFGVGTRTGGGEDIDLFTRVLLAGRALVVEPSAIVWHRHRADLAGLERQARGYGRGLGAWLTKVAMDPATLLLAGRRAPRAIRVLLRKRSTSAAPRRSPGVPPAFPAECFAAIRPELDRIARLELGAVAGGPWNYLRQRLAREGLLTR